jgi:hypothetical protein
MPLLSCKFIAVIERGFAYLQKNGDATNRGVCKVENPVKIEVWSDFV